MTMIKEGPIELYRGDRYTPDMIDLELATMRIQKYDEDKAPRIGDIVITPNGEARLGVEWDDYFQFTDPKWASSFYLGNGYVEASAAFEGHAPKDRLEDTGEKRPAVFWIEHHAHLIGGTPILSAGCAVHVRFPVRVYRIKAKEEPR